MINLSTLSDRKGGRSVQFKDVIKVLFFIDLGLLTCTRTVCHIDTGFVF